MIDLVQLRRNLEVVLKALAKKDPHFPAHKLVELDKEVRSLQQKVDDLRAEKNRLAQAAKQSITPEIREKSKEVGVELKKKEAALLEGQEAFKALYLECPNLASDDVPVGGKEANKVIAQWGAKPSFDFKPKNHLELGNALGWFDFEAAARMTGARFALYKGTAVELMYALSMYMMRHNRDKGYHLVLPPSLVNEASLEVASNFPKFRDQVYAVPEDGLFLTPTAEVNLTNMYRNAILAVDELPIRMTSWTSCFRREAGGYGATERGLIRIHQFEKCELYTICTPEKSVSEHERMLACAEELLQAFGLHYRVVLLAGQDCSFSSVKTYDLEVWLPGQQEYKEVSSISRCNAFQARRGKIRYKDSVDGKTKFVHTLNGSSLALARLMVAIMETYQQADGSIATPQVLQGHGLW